MLLIKNGRVVDPVRKTDAALDVLLDGERVAEVAPAGKISAEDMEMFDASGLIVAPGFIETDMTRALPEAHRGAYLAQIPVGRFGAAEEVAHAVLFLASREAGYITGQTLHVNGGMYMG